MPDEEVLKVLAGYQQGYIDALEYIMKLAEEELARKIEEIKIANPE